VVNGKKNESRGDQATSEETELAGGPPGARTKSVGPLYSSAVVGRRRPQLRGAWGVGRNQVVAPAVVPAHPCAGRPVPFAAPQDVQNVLPMPKRSATGLNEGNRLDSPILHATS